MKQRLLRYALAGVVLFTTALLVPMPAQAATDGDSTLTAGESLDPAAPSDFLYSDTSQYMLDLQSDGNLVERNSQGHVTLWHTGTYGDPGARAVMQGDGNFVVYTATGRPLFSTGTSGNPGAVLKLQDDGNIVVYSAAGRALWASHTRADTLYEGDIIINETGDYLHTPSGRYKAYLEGRQLVVATASADLWRSPYAGEPQSLDGLFVQEDGNVVIYEGQGSQPLVPIWSTGTYGNPGSRLVIQEDGNLVVYAANGRALWSSQYGRIA